MCVQCSFCGGGCWLMLPLGCCGCSFMYVVTRVLLFREFLCWCVVRCCLLFHAICHVLFVVDVGVVWLLFFVVVV